MGFQKQITQASEFLQQAQQDLIDEMRTYPTPISGCDAQYNFLISERQKVSSALAALASEVFVPTPRQPSADVPIEQR